LEVLFSSLIKLQHDNSIAQKERRKERREGGINGRRKKGREGGKEGGRKERRRDGSDLLTN
jgi:hypothetical protein